MRRVVGGVVLEFWAVVLLASLFVPTQAGAATPTLQSSSAVTRTWTDASGRFQTDAILLDGDASHVRLQKIHGSVIAVSLDRLSAADREFVARSLRLSPLAARSGPTTVVAKKVPLPTDDSGMSSDWLAHLKSSWMALGVPATDAGAVSTLAQMFSSSAPAMPRNMIYVRLSRPFLKRLVEKRVAKDEAIHDVVLGYDVGGTSHCDGTSQFELVPSTTSGGAVIRLFGSTKYHSVADAGPIQVLTSGVTQFASAKALRIDGDGFHLGPAVTNAQTSSTVTGVSTSLPGLRGRIALRIGSRRAAETRAEAAEITSQHTAARINGHFDREASEQLADAWRLFSSEFAVLPADDLLRQSTWQASSTSDALQIVVVAPGDKDFQTVAAPIPAAPEADVEVQIHVAMVRYAVTDPPLQKLLAPGNIQLASFHAASKQPLSIGNPAMRWSPNREWLTLDWPASSAPPQRSPPRAPILASQSQ